MAGQPIAVLSEETDGTEFLRRCLRDQLVGTEAEVGFVLKRPNRPGGLHVVLDRSGFVVGRTRQAEHAAAIIVHHLAGLLAPPEGTIRLRLRALVDRSGGAVLVGFPLLVTPPLVERRLERSGLRVVDRLVTDVTQEVSVHLTPTPWLDNVGQTVDGHVPAPSAPVPVRGVLLPGVVTGSVSRATAVAALASAVVAGSGSEPSRRARLDAAELMADGEVRSVDVNDRSATYVALDRLVGESDQLGR